LKETPYYSPSGIKSLLSQNGIYLTKARGQHFLTDKNTLLKIIEGAEINPGDTVLEIGPGIGSLTHLLLEKCSNLHLVEYDRKIFELITKLFNGNDNITIHHCDFLKFDFKSVGDKNAKIKICANIPYNITSKIIERILLFKDFVDTFTLTMQREVAERIVAKEGTKAYGSISVFCRTFTDPEITHIIPPNVFFPKPKVDSAVVHFKIKEKKFDIDNEKVFFAIVKSIFSKRRKTIKNALIGNQFLTAESSSILKALDICDIPHDYRGEKLDIHKTAELSNILYKLINNL
jgi:16S rRNA (adenine1518-N6/adenine1519-N6)-dimethyltransferase